MARIDPDGVLGTVLKGTYRIEQVIGQGAVGVVFRATHTRTFRSFAVKLLRVKPSDRELSRFEREAQVTCAIGHPHIVEVYDFDRTADGKPFLVMELLEGHSLETHPLRRSVDLDALCSVVRQACSALKAAHFVGVVHRDLKPSNIFLCQRGGRDDYVKITDFGISKVHGSLLTRANVAMGTPAYMSPEQAAGRSAEVDGRADLFALGVILYELLAGELPFGSGSLLEMSYRILNEEPRPLRTLCPVLPSGIDELVHWCLQKDPADRPQTAEVLADAFRGAAEGATPPRRLVDGPPPLPVTASSSLDISLVVTTASDALQDVPTVPDVVSSPLSPQPRGAVARSPVPAQARGALVVAPTVPEAAPPAVGAPTVPERQSMPGPPTGRRGPRIALLVACASLAALGGAVGWMLVRQGNGTEVTSATQLSQDAAVDSTRQGPDASASLALVRIVATSAQGNPLAADITVDGRKAGRSPLLLRLLPGEHRLVAAHQGYLPLAQRLVLSDAEPRVVLLQLERRAP